MKRPFVESLVPALAQVFAALLLAATYYINIAAARAGFDQLKDFGSFLAAGQLAAQGKNPYSNDSPLIFSVDFDKLGHSGSAPNLNPPISVLLFELLANADPVASVKTWRALSVILYLGVVIALIPGGGTKPNALWRIAWALSLAGFWHTIELGQIYTLLLVLSAGVFIAAEKGKPVAAGILLGVLIALKPNFVFWALAFGAAGYWSAFFAAAVCSLAISLLPVFFRGVGIYAQWLEASRLFTPDLLIFPGNNSLQGLTARFGSAETGIIFSVILAIAVLIVIRQRRPDITSVNSLAVVVSLLISPIAWTGYTILLLPLFTRIEWKTARWFSACVFSFPFFLALALFEGSFVNFVVFGWFYGWGLLSLLFGEIRSVFR